MGIVDFLGRLMRSVGNNMDNDPQDVLNTKQNLRNAGYLEDDQQELETPFITRKMDDGIRAFQRDKNLKVDGIMNPGGETERGLFEFLTKENADDVFGKTTNEAGRVGFGGNVSGTFAPVPVRKPEIIAPTAKGDALLDFIGKIESDDNYNVIVGGQEKPLTKMTIKEVLQLQKDLDNKKQNTAVGRYQIKNATLKEVIDKLGVDENEIFDEKMQDKMGRKLLEKRGFEDFKAGKISAKELIKGLSKEWAALPADETNESHYKGIGNNKALADFEAIRKLLEKSNF